MKELSFDTETTSHSQVSQPRYNLNEGYINYQSVNKFLFCTHLYEGSGGIMDGSYLIPFSRELFYNTRKIFSPYRNFVKPIINAMVDPVFSSNIIRKFDNDMYYEFVYDADNRKNNLNDILYEAAILARLHGVTFLVMDNFEKDLIPETRLEAIKERKFPYIYIKPAYTVIDYKEDKFNRLLSITFLGKPEKIDGKEYKIYFKFDDMNITKIFIDGDKVIKAIPTMHGLGMIPVVSIYSTSNSEVLPMPPTYDICKLNLALYNKDSELRDQERAQAFSVFYAQLGTNGNNNITIGPHSMINLPSDPNITIAPGYASPDPSILSQLTNSCETFIESIFRAAQQSGVIGLKSVASGIAEAYKFQSTNEQLKKTATMIQNAEYHIAELFSKYTNEEPFEFEVNYQKDYNVFYNNMTADDASKLLALDLPDKVKNEIKKTIINRFLNHLDSDYINTISNFD